MLKIITPTRVITCWRAYEGRREPAKYFSDEAADKYIASWKITLPDLVFEVEFSSKAITKPTASLPVLPVEKPAKQKAIEAASADKIEACKTINDMTDIAQALRLREIDVNKEMENWLGTKKTTTAKDYRIHILKFLNYAKERGIEPVMVEPDDIRAFLGWLGDSGAKVPTIRLTVTACRSLFYALIENHREKIGNWSNPFKSQSLMPQNVRVNKLWVFSETEVGKISALVKDDPVVHTDVILMERYGMRVGGLVKMVLEGNQAVTISKGKRLVYQFDKESVEMWKATPLNKFTAAQLSNKIRYRLKKIYERHEVEHQYSAHKYRHFVALRIYKETGDVHKVQKALRHSSLATTGTYLEGLEKEGLSGEEAETEIGAIGHPDFESL